MYLPESLHTIIGEVGYVIYMVFFDHKFSTCLCFNLSCNRRPCSKRWLFPIIESLLRWYSLIMRKLVKRVYCTTTLKGLGCWTAWPQQGYPWAERDNRSSKAEQTDLTTITKQICSPWLRFQGLFANRAISLLQNITLECSICTWFLVLFNHNYRLLV